VFRPPPASAKDADEILARDDETCARLWSAFRSNPYYARFGTFAVVAQNGGALLRGPAIAEGTASKPAYLNQFLATFGKILGFDPGTFLAPSSGKPKDLPVAGAFRD
jgi:hypothetical protein